MFWGTDITRMPCSWRQCVTVFTEELPWLKGRDLDLVMGEALCSWVGWRLPAERSYRQGTLPSPPAGSRFSAACGHF
jgi:hypothetical protein